MKYNFEWFFLIIVMIVFVDCKRSPRANKDEIVINGQLTNSSGKMVKLSEIDKNSVQVIDSAIIGKEETFSFRVKIINSGFYTISIHKNDNAILIGKKGETIKLTGDAEHLSNTWTAKGSDETLIYLNYWKVSRKQLKTIDSLTFIFRSSHLSPESMTTRIRLDSIFNAIMDEQREAATHFVARNPCSLASLLVINAKFSKMPLFSEERDLNYFKSIDSCLFKSYHENKLVDEFHQRVQQMTKRVKNHQENHHLLPPGELNPSYKSNR